MFIKIKKKAVELSREKPASLFAVNIIRAAFIGSLIALSEMLNKLIPENKAIFLAVRASAFLFICTAIFVSLILLRAGVDRFFYQRARGVKESAFAILFYFEKAHFKKGLFFYLRYFLFFLRDALLFFLPSASVSFLIFSFYKEGLSSRVLIAFLVGNFFFYALSLLFFFRVRRLFFLAPYFFFENESLSYGAAAEKSLSLMRDSGWELIRLKKSFFFVSLLSVFVFTVPFVWGSIKQSLAIYALVKTRKEK